MNPGLFPLPLVGIMLSTYLHDQHGPWQTTIKRQFHLSTLFIIWTSVLSMIKNSFFSVQPGYSGS